MFIKWLQDVFNCPLVIQISDEEKFYFKHMDFNDVQKLGLENVKDIIACGFNPNKTFIFSNREYRLNVRQFEIFVSTMKSYVSMYTIRKIFGFNDDKMSIGCYDWPFYQAGAAFSKAFPHIFHNKHAHCLVANAIDQDPYFRLARDVADEMEIIKPHSIMSTFLPLLTGYGKMSSSVGMETTIFLTYNLKVIKAKVKKYAFSGSKGNGSLIEHKKYGGDTQKDISYQYLKYFENDEEKLLKIQEQFSSGIMTCSEIKEIMSDKIIEIITLHQQNRAKITTEMITQFYDMKELCKS